VVWSESEELEEEEEEEEKSGGIWWDDSWELDRRTRKRMKRKARQIRRSLRLRLNWVFDDLIFRQVRS